MEKSKKSHCYTFKSVYKMKRLYLLFIILLSNVLLAFTQTNETLEKRIKNGTLTYKECNELISHGRVEEAVFSLHNFILRFEESECCDVNDYQDAVLQISNYYNEIGNIFESRKYLYNAMQYIDKHINNPDSKFYHSYNDGFIPVLWLELGKMEILTNDYITAKSYFHRLQMTCDYNNFSGILYITVLHNMAIAYLRENNLLLAKLYIEEARDLYENIYGNKQNEDFIFLLNYSQVCAALGKVEESENNLKYIIKNSVPSSEIYQLACNALSVCLMKKGKWNESLSYLEKIETKNNEIAKDINSNLIINYLYLNKWDKAVKILENFNKYSIEHICSLLSNYPRTLSENYISTLLMNVLSLNTFAAYKTQLNSVLTSAYNNVSFSKSLSFNYFSIMRNYIKKSKDNSLINTFTEYSNLRNRLMYPIEDFLEEHNVILNILQKESTLLNSIKSMKTELLKQVKNDRFNKIRSSLDYDEIAVDFCYLPIIDSFANITMSYCAFAIKKDFEAPKLIILSDILSMKETVLNLDSDEENITNLYSNSNLYKLFWEKLQPDLNNISTIYYSTTGHLSYINNNLITNLEGECLGEKYRMIQLISTEELDIYKDRINNKSSKIESSLLYGDITYDHVFENNDLQGKNIYIKEPSIYTNRKWNPLKATKDEVESIANTLNKNNVEVRILTGKSANENSFKSLNGNSPEILHIATHAFVIDDNDEYDKNKMFQKTISYSDRDKYLQWTGLLMSGCNAAWNNNWFDPNEDGILTADEISRLDLSKTKLVVLSACETARGNLDVIDNVLGLQHAFKRAGVNTIIMSLWKVPDESTSYLMKNFYLFLLQGNDANNALKMAMKETKKIYKNPYYWGGFIVLN